MNIRKQWVATMVDIRLHPEEENATFPILGWKLSHANRVLYFVALACLAAGALVALLLIWLGLTNALVWRTIGTLVWLMLASLAMVGANLLIGNYVTTTVNRACFGVCLTTMLVGTIMGFILIWSDSMQTFAWKSIASCAVIFCTSAGAIAINAVFQQKRPNSPVPPPLPRDAPGGYPMATIAEDDTGERGRSRYSDLG
jgi:hypothetical protein